VYEAHRELTVARASEFARHPERPQPLRAPAVAVLQLPARLARQPSLGQELRLERRKLVLRKRRARAASSVSSGESAKFTRLRRKAFGRSRSIDFIKRSIVCYT
jgi:hypothetical protein